jgi:hypothetical protein
MENNLNQEILMDNNRKLIRIAFIGRPEQGVGIQDKLSREMKRRIKWDSYQIDEASSVDVVKYDAVITAAGSKQSGKLFVRSMAEMLNSLKP